MLGWIIGLAAVAVLSIVAVDLLENEDIFGNGMEGRTGTGGLLPYEHIEALSCDTELEFTDMDRSRAETMVHEIRDLLGDNPVESLSRMDAKSRIEAAEELHMRLCTGISLNLGLEMGEPQDMAISGCYIESRKIMWIDYRYLLSENPEYIAEYLDTVIHEFRHAMQYRFVEDDGYNGVDRNYRERMTVSLNPSIYVHFNENPELYTKQLCERDAKAYAAMVMQLLKGEKQND